MTNTCAVDQIVNIPARKDRILYLFMTRNPTLVMKCETAPGFGHDVVMIDS